MTTRYECSNSQRIAILRDYDKINGIDYLEVVDNESDPPNIRQRFLVVHFIHPLTALPSPDQVRILGGDRVQNIRVVDVKPGDAPEIMIVEVNQAGDFSAYALQLVKGIKDDAPPDGIDPILREIDFSFKVECPTDFDCESPPLPVPETRTEPQIDYLAKDYASFRRVMLDRMAQLMPAWQDRNPADVGIVLVELLAYLGDQLSYRQDALATEAYLYTARQRISVRRHARLVDYFMDDGSNARVWVQIKVVTDIVRGAGLPSPLPKGTKLLTRVNGVPDRVAPEDMPYREAARLGAEVFETLEDADKLYTAHNRMSFYTWGDDQCCLPAGSTSVTLRGPLPNLEKNMVLVFQEVVDPKTGRPEDADPQRRHAVRLTSVKPVTDELGGWYEAPADQKDTALPLQLVEIAWGTQDALPFTLCISSEIASEVSIALGNIVLADHGGTLDQPEYLGQVPPVELTAVQRIGTNCGPDALDIPARFRPRLNWKPLTQVAHISVKVVENGVASMENLPFDPDASATAAFSMQDARYLPAITVYETMTNDALTQCPPAGLTEWQPQRDLLNSSADSLEFVAETRDDGTAVLRFGDQTFGARPDEGRHFWACYRIGTGTRGNIGTGALAHIVTNESAVQSVTNPLPAHGGREPETIEEVRRNAPVAFRTQERAVTADDYARVAERHPEVLRAVASFRWTGSWRTVYVTIDRRGGLPIDADFEGEMRALMEKYRMAGYDIEINAPIFMSLEIEMIVCVKPDYFRSQVDSELRIVFSNGVRPNGQLGLFHPDNFTFGQTIYLSPFYAAALSVAGVDTVEITKFQLLGNDSTSALATGTLTLSHLQIVRLSNDPNFPDRGVFQLTTKGGK
ncbi:MAG: putative baseplate assembly protein [Chloroflexi bacterium]|nr:putative baseplate assembly protein [Chloroflexota bacterium]